MTPARARRRSRWWFAAAVVALVVGESLLLTGLPAMPIVGGALVAALLSAHWRGWAIGHDVATRIDE